MVRAASHLVKILAFLFSLMIVLMGGYATRDLLRSTSARRTVSGVLIGDAKSQVLAALGQPARTRPVVPITAIPLGFQPVLWCYGRILALIPLPCGIGLLWLSCA